MYLVSNPTTGNNALTITWSMSANKYANINSKTGLVTVHTLPSAGLEPTATVTCTVTKLNGGVLSAQMTVMFYQPDAKVGDYVYHDGTYSTQMNTSKTIVGMVLDVDETGKHGWCVASNFYTYGQYDYAGHVFTIRNAGWQINAYVTDTDTYTGRIPYGTYKTLILNDDGTFKTFSVGALSKDDIIKNNNLLYNYVKTRIEGLGRQMPTNEQEMEQAFQDYPADIDMYVPLLLNVRFFEPNANDLNPIFSEGNWYIISIKLLSRLMYLQYEFTNRLQSANITTIPEDTWMNTCDYGIGGNGYAGDEICSIWHSRNNI